MAQIKKNAGNLNLNDPFYVVVEKPLFEDSKLKKAEVLSRRIKSLGFGPGQNEDLCVINGDHTVKVSGNAEPGIGDLVYNANDAKEIWGISMENSVKAAKKQLEIAKRDLEAVENYRTVIEKTLLKEDLGFDKKGKIKELIDTGEGSDVILKPSKSYKSTD